MTQNETILNGLPRICTVSAVVTILPNMWFPWKPYKPILRNTCALPGCCTRPRVNTDQWGRSFREGSGQQARPQCVRDNDHSPLAELIENWLLYEQSEPACGTTALCVSSRESSEFKRCMGKRVEGDVTLFPIQIAQTIFVT